MYDSEAYFELEIVEDDDTDDDTVTLTFAVTSADPTYDGLALPDVVVTVTEGVTYPIGHDWSDYTATNPLELPEDGSNQDDNYAYLWLTSEPTADVIVTVTSSDASVLKVGSGTFGASYAQTVTTNAWSEGDSEAYFELEVVEDDDTDDDMVTLTFAVTSADPTYDGLALPDVVVTVTEGVTYPIGHDWSDYTATNPLELPEDGSNQDDNYAYLWLTSEPTADVTVTVTSSDASVLKVGSGTFGASYAQTVTTNAWNKGDSEAYFELEVVEDDDTDDDTVTLTFTVASGDTNYDGLEIASVSVTVTEVGVTDAPTMEIVVPSGINSTAPFTASFEFSEAVTGFAASDVTVTGGAKGTFSGSDSSYTLVVTPAGSGDVTVTVAANAAEDGEGNTGPASAVSATAAWETTAPTLEIVVPSEVGSAPFTASFEFSEAVTGFDASDVTVTGGAKGAFAGSDSSYTLVVTPAGSADVTVTVGANAAEDGEGNTGPASAVSATALKDTTAPEVVGIGRPSWINSTADFTASFEFSEAVTGFDASDVTVTGGAKGTFSGSGSSYTLVVTPAGTVDVTVEVAANAAEDGAGNTGPALVAGVTVVWDTTAPTVDIGVPSGISSTADFTASFEFSEAVTGFADGRRDGDGWREGRVRGERLELRPGGDAGGDGGRDGGGGGERGGGRRGHHGPGVGGERDGGVGTRPLRRWISECRPRSGRPTSRRVSSFRRR